jgi:hypothetical protein
LVSLDGNKVEMSLDIHDLLHYLYSNLLKLLSILKSNHGMAMNIYGLSFVLFVPELESKIIIQTQPDPDWIRIFDTLTQPDWVLSIHNPNPNQLKTRI